MTHTDNTDMPSKAQLWRAETMRLLDVQLDSGISSNAPTRGPQAWSGRLAANSLTRYVDQFLAIMSKSKQAECQADLQILYEKAWRLSIKLWSQGSKLHIYASKEIPKQSLSVPSDTYKPHWSMGVEEDDYSFDESQTHLIITPLFASTTSYDTEANLRTTKIWQKAIVLAYGDREQPMTEAERYCVRKATTSLKRSEPQASDEKMQVKRQKNSQTTESESRAADTSRLVHGSAQTHGCKMALFAPLRSPRSSSVESVLRNATVASPNQQQRVTDEPDSSCMGAVPLPNTTNPEDRRPEVRRRTKSVEHSGSPYRLPRRTNRRSFDRLDRKGLYSGHEASAEARSSSNVAGRDGKNVRDRSHQSLSEQLEHNTTIDRKCSEQHLPQYHVLIPRRFTRACQG